MSQEPKRTADMYNFGLYRLSGRIFQLVGQMRNHPTIRDNDTGHSGDLLRIDFEKMEAETTSTIWRIHADMAPVKEN